MRTSACLESRAEQASVRAIRAKQEDLPSARKMSLDPTRHSVIPDLLSLKFSGLILRKTRASLPVG